MATGEERLKRFYARRSRALLAFAVGGAAQGAVYGGSVLADNLNVVFSPNFTTEKTFNYPGIYAVALTAGLMFGFGGRVVVPFYKRWPKHKKTFQLCMIWLLPIGQVLTALSVRFTSQALLYVGMCLFTGMAYAVFNVMVKLELLQWFGLDDKVNVGVSVVGFGVGFSAIMFTLVTGWIIAYSSPLPAKGLEICFYCLAGIQSLFCIYFTYVILGGTLDPPPSPKEFREWELAAADSEGSIASSSKDDLHRPAGTSSLYPKVYTSKVEVLKKPISWVVHFFAFSIVFNGLATKVLLSSMFVLIFKVEGLLATYLSAISLLVFFIGRCLVPYYFLGKNSKVKVHAALLISVILIISGIGYVVVPSIVGDKTYDGGFSWQLFGFVVAKAFIGGTFSAAGGLTGPLGNTLVGTANLRTFLITLWDVTCIGSIAGVVVCMAIVTIQYDGGNGESFARAFSVFFYVAGGIAFLNSVLLLVSYLVHKKADQEEQQRLKNILEEQQEQGQEQEQEQEQEQKQNSLIKV